MTGVVETDNLRRNFTFNLKIQMPNIKVNFPAGVPLSGFIPIPRHYADEFTIVDALDVFDKDLVDEENKSTRDATEKDPIQNQNFLAELEEIILLDKMYMEINSQTTSYHKLPLTNWAFSI